MKKKKSSARYLQDEYKTLAYSLHSSEADVETREKLEYDLKWLKKQMDYYEGKKDMDPLLECYNHVVEDFNSLLKLPKNEEFKKK